MGLIENLERFDSEPKTFSDFYELLLNILNNWIEFSDKNYTKLVALWILGTYFHDKFVSYPYLFINAMKRSGKSKLLHLISTLAYKGTTTARLTDAVLFRISIKKPTICIDEFENLTNHEQFNLSELLNAGYKKGLTITRMKRNNETHDFEPTDFPVFTPIVLANITGVDDVLADRCIIIPLERSDLTQIIIKPEFFEMDNNINMWLKSLPQFSVVMSLVHERHVYHGFADWLKSNVDWLKSNIYDITSSTTLTTQETTLTTANSTTNNNNNNNTNNTIKTLPPQKIQEIINYGIVARDLELFYPLFWLSYNVSENVFNELLPFVFKIIKEKQEIEQIENRDIIFLSFIFNKYSENSDWFKVTTIVSDFQLNEPNTKWFTARWVGKAINRHHIAYERKRTSTGHFVIFNWEKIKKLCKKLKIEKEQIEETQKTLSVEDGLKELDKNYAEFLENKSSGKSEV